MNVIRYIYCITIISSFFVIIPTVASIADTNTKNESSKADIRLKNIQDLLDSWNGQGEILYQAKKEIDEALKAEPDNVFVLKELARYYTMDGFIKTNRTIDGNGKEIYTNEYKLGALKNAENTLLKAIKIDPNFASGYVVLANIYTNQSKLKEARSALEKAESIGTDDLWLQLNWASILYIEGDKSAAAERYKKVLQSNTTNKKILTSAYGFLISDSMDKKDYAKVNELYNKLFEINPTDAWAMGNYAEYLRTEVGDVDKALQYAIKSIQTMDYGVGRRILSSCLYAKWADIVVNHKEQKAEAEKYFVAAQKFRPNLDSVMANEGAYATGKSVVLALKEKGISIDAGDTDGSTAFIIAANNGRVDALQMLLSLGANPNAVAKTGWTALLGATDSGKIDAVKFLLKNGADTTKTINGKSALEIATSNGNTKLAEVIKQYIINQKK